MSATIKFLNKLMMFILLSLLFVINCQSVFVQNQFSNVYLCNLSHNNYNAKILEKIMMSPGRIIMKINIILMRDLRGEGSMQ